MTVGNTTFYFDTYSKCQSCTNQWLGEKDLCQSCGSENILTARAKVKNTYSSWSTGFLGCKTITHEIKEIISLNDQSTSIVIKDETTSTNGYS